MLISSNLSPASGQLVEEGATFDYADDHFMLVDEFGDLVPESSHTVEIQYVNADVDQADSGNESEEKISCQEDLKIEESKCRCNDVEVENDSAFEEDLTNLTWLQNITNIMSVPSLSLTPVSPKPVPKVHKSRLNKLYQTIAKCQEDFMKNLNEYQTNVNMKPPYSYCTLICMAMRYNNNKMTLSAIYTWIKDNFRYYRNADPSWQNSIRHNLSLNKVFVKVARSKQEKGKGGFWKLELARLNECHKCGSNEPVKYQRKKRKIKPPAELAKEEPPATPAECFAPETTVKNSPFHDFNLESLSGFSFDNNVGANVVVEPALPPPLIPEEDLLGLLLVPNDWEDMQLEMLDSIMDSCFK